MFGGRSAETGELLADLYSLDLESMRWTLLRPSGHTPSPRVRHTLTYVDGFLYLLGGNGANASIFVQDSFWRYDIKAGMWDTLPPCPTIDNVIAGHAAGALKDEGIVVVGGCSTIFGREPYLLLFDTAGGRWSNIEADIQMFSPATAPEDHAMTTMRIAEATYFVIHGGISTAGSPNAIQILKYQDRSFRWYTPTAKTVTVDVPPTELSKHNLVLIKNRLIFIGGTTQFARESDEATQVGCCGVGAVKTVSPREKIPVIYLVKELASGGQAKQSCCTIL